MGEREAFNLCERGSDERASKPVCTQEVNNRLGEHSKKRCTCMFKLNAEECIARHTNVSFAPGNAFERRELRPEIPFFYSCSGVAGGAQPDGVVQGYLAHKQLPPP